MAKVFGVAVKAPSHTHPPKAGLHLFAWKYIYYEQRMLAFLNLEAAEMNSFISSHITSQKQQQQPQLDQKHCGFIRNWCDRM